MNYNDKEYLRIKKKYNIPDNLALREVNRIILKEMKKNHPDVNNKPNAEEIFKEINNDNLFIKKLIREYGENYIYVVNQNTNTNNNNRNNTNTNSNNRNNTNTNTNTNTNNNNRNNTNTNNNNKNNTNTNNNNRRNNTDNSYKKQNRENIDDEIQMFKNKLYNIKSKYYYINDIVNYVNYLLNERLNNIRTKNELNQLDKQLNFNVRYYFLISTIYYNKAKYEDDEINKISEHILNILINVKTEEELIRIESSYYNQIIPIEEKIKREISIKIKPIEEIIKIISSYSNINISYFEQSNWLDKLNSIYSIKKIEDTVNDILFEIKSLIISNIKNLLNNLNDNYYDYATQLLLKIDSTHNFQELSSIIKDYDNYLSVYIKNESTKIKNGLLEFSNKYELPDYEKTTIDGYISDLDNVNNITEFLDINNTIKNYRLDMLKSLFRQKIYNNNTIGKIQSKYLYDMYKITTEEQMIEFMNEYENDLEKENKNKEILDNTKNELIKFINNLKNKYPKIDFNHDLWEIDHSKNPEDLHKIVDDIQRKILDFEKKKFLQEIYKDMNYDKLHNIAMDVHNKIYQTESITDLLNLKNKYHEEKEKIINFEESKNR